MSDIPSIEGEFDAAPDTEFDELERCLDAMRDIMQLEVRLIDHLIHSFVAGQHGPALWRFQGAVSPGVRKIVPIMIQSAGSSCHSVLRLSNELCLSVKDCFPIARGVVETIINVCYILAVGDEAAGRADRHAFQKAFRDMDRISQVGGCSIRSTWSSKPDPSTVAGLPEALAEFTRKNGGEKTNWTDDSIERRLEIVGNRYGTRVLMPLQVGFFAIYRHASEIQHGTFFGSLFFFDAIRPPRENTPARGRLVVGNHLLGIYFNLISVINALMSACGQEFSAYEFPKASDAFFDRLRDIPLIKRHLGPGSPQ
jgi:hypothetical protein